MADDVTFQTSRLATPPDATVVATDEIAGKHYQRMKATFGADGTATDVSAADPLPVTVGSSALPSGAATAAHQVTIIGHVDGLEGLLTTIDADTGTLAGAVSGTEMQVDVVTSALPTGAATSAKQDTIIGHVDGIEALLTTIDADTSALFGTVAGTEVQVDVVAALPAGTNNIGDVDIASIAAGDNNIGNVDIVSVPAPLSTTGGGTEAAALRVTIATDSTGVVSVDDNGAALTVDNAGTFAVQAAQSGTWNITDISGTVSLPTGAATSAKQDTIIGHLDGVETTLTAIDGRVDGLETSNSAIQTAVELIDDTVATLGTTTYTEATSKGVTIGAVRRDADTTLVNTTNEIGPLQMDANGRLKVEAFSGETLPVSLTSTTITGTVAVTQSGTWDEVGINDSGNSITVDAPVGTPVFVRLSDGSAAISTLPVSLATVPSHAVTNAGTFATQVDGAALTALQLIDDIVYTDDTSTHATGTSKGALFMAAATPTDTSVNANDIGAVAMTTDRKLHVSVQDTIANVTTVATVTTLTGGGVAHDGADSGNPIKVGARAAATLSDDTMVANADRADNVADLDGALIVRQQFPLGDLLSERVTNTDGASTAFSTFGATANTRSYVTAIVVYNSSATNGTIDFRDGTAGSVLYTVPIPTTGGAVITCGGAPLFRTTANTALAYDVSGALSTVTISISGFKSKV